MRTKSGLKLGGLLFTGLSVGWSSPAATELPPRPDIVFCFASDWGCYASAYAAADNRPSVNQVLHTPNHTPNLAKNVAVLHPPRP